MAEGNLEEVQAANEIDDTAVTHIKQLFVSSAAVIAYLIFILLYTPCVAALGAVYREAGFKWTVLVASWTFIIGWICATAYYQTSLLGTAQNAQAVCWLIGLMVMLVALFFVLRQIGKKEIFSGSKHIVAMSHLKNGKGSCC